MAAQSAISRRRMNKTVRILGTHGVPAAYGGFETAAENVALFLIRHGWRVVVYCQVEGTGPLTVDTWQGIERVKIPINKPGWRGTSLFDLRSIRHACQFGDLCLTFGYNTAIFNVLQRILGIPNVINMDGIEWSRKRWGFVKQAILYSNERIACFVGNHLIADHPEIERYLVGRASRRKISTITYGGDPVVDAPADQVRALGLEPGEYLTLIARPIPENSILEIVAGFSHARRGKKLAILGDYDPAADEYHARVAAAASDEVLFLGAIYETSIVKALRYHCVAYVHGHTVGGTNPSLVEAMAASNAVIAHDNPYNRWVARDGALYFDSSASFADRLSILLSDSALRERLRTASHIRFLEEFTWDHVAGQYEELLLRFLPAESQRSNESRATHTEPM
jgi:glycosyltransferase involved in cell wall biosynthesis